MRTNTFFITAVLAATAAACTTDAPEAPTFEAVMTRVIEPGCTFSSCHAAPTKAAQLDLTPERVCDTLINKPSCLFPDRMRVVPGHPEESFFFHKLTGEGLHEAPTGSDCSSATTTNQIMPYGAKGLGDDAIELVHNWIIAGAECKGTGPTGPSGPAIASFTANHGAPLAGEPFAFTVTLDRAAPEGGQQIYVDTSSGALSAPLQVTVPATKTTVQFDGIAMWPTSRFTIRARSGESSKELVLRVAGLDISEVLADPFGNDEDLQWVKLRNRSSVSIDLNSYQLKAGQTSYDLVTVQLVGMLPPGGCAVIGGPTQSVANGEPIFTQPVNFTPDLPISGPRAAGFALFDRNAAAVGGISTPVDTMLVGANNYAQLVGPDAEIPSPHCARPAPGMSALRTGPGTCVEAMMQPRECI